MAHLTLLLDNREVRKFVLNRGITTIGRAQDNDIVINNLALSRRHAQVEYKAGRFEVVDLKSQNGVYVNQERVRGPRSLDDRDAITLGTYQFVFRSSDDSEPEVRAAAPARARPRPETTDAGGDDEPSGGAAEGGDAEVPLLVLKYNDVELQRFPIRSESCLVGRAKECDVQIPERRLSRKHCDIRKTGSRFVVHDLGSQNGTYVNRKRIRGTHELEHGDVLNFAEYSVLYLAEAGSYQGPDAGEAPAGRAAAARIAAPPGFEKDETAVPRAYRDDDAPIRPVDLTDDPESSALPSPPVVMSPRSRRALPEAEPARDPLTKSPAEARAKRTGRVARTEPEPTPRRSEQPAPRRTQPPPAEEPRVRPSAPPTKGGRPVRAEPPRRRQERAPIEEDDVVDHEAHDPDEALDDWYQARHERSEMFEPPVASEDPDSLLPPRGQSSVSQVLSQMMIGKSELATNLQQPKARKRRFSVDVRHHDKLLYSGPLTEAVTIMGTDREADIQLKGRYVAGRHSLLVRVRDSLLLVRLGSSSAARVNGLPKLQAFLKTGDVIQIDETTITITEE